MERRKDTPYTGVKLPRDYLKMVEDVFNKNFAKHLIKEKTTKEKFVTHGEIYSDELVLAISLKNPATLRMTTCYGSVDYPPAQLKGEKTESVGGESVSEGVQLAVNQCVDAIASFFNTFFEEGRPVDYDMEYRQNWTAVDIDKVTRVHLCINHDNPELDAQADALLELDEDTKKKKKLH